MNDAPNPTPAAGAAGAPGRAAGPRRSSRSLEYQCAGDDSQDQLRARVSAEGRSPRARPQVMGMMAPTDRGDGCDLADLPHRQSPIEAAEAGHVEQSALLRPAAWPGPRSGLRRAAPRPPLRPGPSPGRRRGPPGCWPAATPAHRGNHHCRTRRRPGYRREQPPSDSTGGLPGRGVTECRTVAGPRSSPNPDVTGSRSDPDTPAHAAPHLERPRTAAVPVEGDPGGGCPAPGRGHIVTFPGARHARPREMMRDHRERGGALQRCGRIDRAGGQRRARGPTTSAAPTSPSCGRPSSSRAAMRSRAWATASWSRSARHRPPWPRGGHAAGGGA